MKNNTRIIVFLLSMYCLNGFSQTHKRNYVYKYDATGNRIQRVYSLLTCPTCRSVKADSINAAVTNSLYQAALDNPIILPEIPTEKFNLGDVAELKNIYPNPTHGNFVVEFTQNILNAKLEVLDMKGNRMDEIILDGNEWQIDLSLYPSGEYILLIRTKEGRTYNKRIMKI
ncbi:MAG: hypothetical protein JWN78_1519 [Bacteroidota bacterium]|nr:hypothetical protein [Bacteroidota bacterium]